MVITVSASPWTPPATPTWPALRFLPTSRPTPGAFQSSDPAAGTYCGFVAKLDPTGTALTYSSYLSASSGSDA
jgi:hypothetical protein